MKNESHLKVEILSKGVTFSLEALNYAREVNAKQQNLCYNAPSCLNIKRPQELLLTGLDGYKTVVSCVSPTGNGKPIHITAIKEKLTVISENDSWENVNVEYVLMPSYYSLRTKSGTPFLNLVSACGYNELNILPWRWCSLPSSCKFCGTNALATHTGYTGLTAHEISNNPEIWNKTKITYLNDLKEAIAASLTDKCYNNDIFPIFISGNLKNLDLQADIYVEILKAVKSLLIQHNLLHIYAIITPPNDINRINKLKQSGFTTVAFNLEVGNEPWFSRYCPGKANLGRNFIQKRLAAAVKIFNYGRVWSNFVFGLEPQKFLLKTCRELMNQGVVPGANVYHRDYGSKLNIAIPESSEIIDFFCELADLYNQNNMQPFYSSLALRTSLANEAYAHRFSS